jgi:hypothetical protein
MDSPDSFSESDNDLEYDSEDDEDFLKLSKSSSGTSTPTPRPKRPKHSIGARIQAVTFLELNIPHLEITARTGISKAQLYKLRNKAISQG